MAQAPLPPLPPEFQAALDRATANASTAFFPLTRSYNDVEFAMKFHTSVSMQGMTIIGNFQRLAAAVGEGDNLPADETMEMVVEFLDEMAHPDTGALVAHLLRSRIMSFQDLVALQGAVMERASGRPFTSSPSSSSGSLPTGPGSTAGAPPEGLTPPTLA